MKQATLLVISARNPVASVDSLHEAPVTLRQNVTIYLPDEFGDEGKTRQSRMIGEKITYQHQTREEIM